MSNNKAQLIYLDTNVYARPFDDQTQQTIQAEADAFMVIIDAVKAQKLQLLKSDILLYEVHNILDEDKKDKVLNYIMFCEYYIESSDNVIELGKQIQEQCSARARDALHIASAIIGNARFFVSCDIRITTMKHARCYRLIAKPFNQPYFSVMNPIRFVERLKKGEFK